MPAAPRSVPDQTRERILVAAEELFRRVGYWKTTVADIAQALGMSSANVYRFFPSKKAINEALCARMLAEVLEVARGAAAGAGPAGERLIASFMILHRHHRETMTSERRVHEMVVVAIEENWSAIAAFLDACARLAGELVAEGQKTGEFGPGDPAALGRLAHSACAVILHPALIAQYADIISDAQAQAIAAFAVRALANPRPPDQ